MTSGFLNVPRERVTGLGLFPKFYHFFVGFPYWETKAWRERKEDRIKFFLKEGVKKKSTFFRKNS